jgi:hypothetical protein
MSCPWTFCKASWRRPEPAAAVSRCFGEAVQLTADAGYDFSLNTNGWNFPRIHPLLLEYRERLHVITFSLDGADAATHDALRGRGAFRRLMQAVSLCVVDGLPFTFNTVITARNRAQLEPTAELARRLGSRGLRLGHLIPTPLTAAQGLDLSPAERKQAEAQVWRLRRTVPFPIAMAAGHHTTDVLPCAALHLQEVNVDCRGYLTTCCNLSGHGEAAGQGDVVAKLGAMSFAEAYLRLKEENARFQAAKLAHLDSGRFADTDFFPCWYCANHYRKVDWLKARPGHPWATLRWNEPWPAALNAPTPRRPEEPGNVA